MNNDKKIDEFLKFLQEEINNNHLSHSYLIEIDNYDEIDKIIKKISKIILCPNKKVKENCNICNICNLINCDNYPDIKVIEPEGNFIKKEQLIYVQEEFSKKSFYDNKQIYFIKEANKLNSSSGNTMLKFLEEPSENIIAILFSTNRYNVLETIISRCQILKLDNKKEIIIDTETEKLINTLLQKNKGFLCYNEIIDIVSDKNKLVDKLKIIQSYFFEKIKNNEIIFGIDNKKKYEFILLLEKYISKCEYNINFKLMLDSFIVEVNKLLK